MAGLAKRREGEVAVHGVAYLLSDDDFVRMIVSEGAGVAYTVVSLLAVQLDNEAEMWVKTLIARTSYGFQQSRCPSRRYMDLIIQGAQEKSLPQKYQNHLLKTRTFHALDSKWWKMGRFFFHKSWLPVSWLVEKGTRRLKDQDGLVGAWYLLMFDLLLYTMWWQHDYLYAPIFGRGDGQ